MFVHYLMIYVFHTGFIPMILARAAFIEIITAGLVLHSAISEQNYYGSDSLMILPRNSNLKNWPCNYMCQSDRDYGTHCMIRIFSFMNINREIDITCIIEKSKILPPSSSTGNSVFTLKTLLPGVMYGKQKRESVCVCVRERERERERESE